MCMCVNVSMQGREREKTGGEGRKGGKREGKEKGLCVVYFHYFIYVTTNTFALLMHRLGSRKS